MAIGLFLLGLLSKTAIVTLPLAWLVIFWWKRGAISWRRDVVPLIPFFFLSVAAGLMTRWLEYGNIGYKARILDFSPLDRCLIAGRAFWFQLGKLLWPSNLMFVYPRWDINAAVWWQYLFPLAVLGLLGILWSLRRWSRAPLAGVLIYIFLLLPSLGFLNIYFFHLFVCSRSLAIFGLPGNHHALRQWDRPAGRTIETLASLAGAWSHAVTRRRTVRAHLAAKPDVYRHRNTLSDDYCP